MDPVYSTKVPVKPGVFFVVITVLVVLVVIAVVVLVPGKPQQVNNETLPQLDINEIITEEVQPQQPQQVVGQDEPIVMDEGYELYEGSVGGQKANILLMPAALRAGNEVGWVEYDNSVFGNILKCTKLNGNDMVLYEYSSSGRHIGTFNGYWLETTLTMWYMGTYVNSRGQSFDFEFATSLIG